MSKWKVTVNHIVAVEIATAIAQHLSKNIEGTGMTVTVEEVEED